MDVPRLKLYIAVCALAGLFVAAALLPVARYTLALVDFARHAGFAGGLVFAAVYAAAALFMVPGSLLTILGGFVWGPGLGVLVVWPGALAGAILAFVAGRFLARDWVERAIAGKPSARVLDEIVGERSFTIIALLRLSPLLPFNLLNYALGTTRARLLPYAAATALGILPGCVLYTYIGSIATDAARLVSGEHPAAGVWGKAFLVAGLLATLAVTVLLARMARRRLQALVEPG